MSRLPETSLSHVVDDLDAFAAAATARFGVRTVSPPVLLSYRENAVFRVDDASTGGRYVIRAHRPALSDRAEHPLRARVDASAAAIGRRHAGGGRRDQRRPGPGGRARRLAGATLLRHDALDRGGPAPRPTTPAATWRRPITWSARSTRGCTATCEGGRRRPASSATPGTRTACSEMRRCGDASAISRR